MIDNILGMGIDVHILGLKQAARENAMACPIFEDDSFRIANQFALSTSQVIHFTFLKRIIGLLKYFIIHLAQIIMNLIKYTRLIKINRKHSNSSIQNILLVL